MRILMIIKTTGLDYDDRIRKEALSLTRLGHNVEIIALEKDNSIRKGLTSYGVKYQTIRLLMRSITSQAKFIGLKTIEMQFKFILRIISEKPDVVWLHNIENIMLIPFLRILKSGGLVKKIVFDQHELPPAKIIKYNAAKWFYKKLLLICDANVVANEERKFYLKDKLKIGSDRIETFYVLENFMDEIFSNQRKHELPGDVKQWLSNSKYILAQGGAGHNRYLEELIEAIITVNKYKLIVVGPYSKDDYNIYLQKWENDFEELIFFTDIVPQLELVKYIDNAYSSLILYNTRLENLRLCAPNRLYQAICRGVPIVVGDNPPMKKILEQYECGVVLEGDGRNVIDIVRALVKIEENYDYYHANTCDIMKEYVWEKQDKIFEKLISRILED